MYIKNYIALLNDEEVYKECRYQTKSINYKVVNQLLDVKKSVGHKFEEQYNKLHPPGGRAFCHKILWSPRIHKANIPSGPQYQHVAVPHTD